MNGTTAAVLITFMLCASTTICFVHYCKLKTAQDHRIAMEVAFKR
jgi:hypothetical protein